MKWFFCWCQDTDFREDHDWKNLILASVKSALANTSLIPYFIYDGEESDFTNILVSLGVKIIYHKISFLDAIVQHNCDRTYQAIARGAFLRFDIALFVDETDEYVLYTDSDVIFLKNPKFDEFQPVLIAAASQHNRSDRFDLNSGVMLINAKSFKNVHQQLVNFTIKNLNLGLDQEVLRVFLEQEYLSLPDEFNWKPYWGISKEATIIHWHGPKPTTIKKYLESTSFESHQTWNELYMCNPRAYSYYLTLHEKFIHFDKEICCHAAFSYSLSEDQKAHSAQYTRVRYVLVDDAFSVLTFNGQNLLCPVDDILELNKVFCFYIAEISTFNSDSFKIEPINFFSKAFDTSEIILSKCSKDSYNLIILDGLDESCGEYTSTISRESHYVTRKPLTLYTYETFLKILWILTNEWVIVGSGKKLCKSEMFVYRQQLFLSKININAKLENIVDEKFFISNNTNYRSFTTFHENWKIDKFLLYRPLVIYCVFGDKVYSEQFSLSCKSLFECGGYTGTVFVITDKTIEYILSLIPALYHSQIMVQKFTGQDKLDYAGARLLISELSHCQNYQPILYLDADIIVDNAIEPALIDVAKSHKLSAWQEVNSPLPTYVSVGGTLFAADPLDLSGQLGFNAGIFGIPNIPELGLVIKSAKTILKNYSATFGRASLPWLDQSALNYAARKLDMFVPDLLDRYVRLPPAADGVMNTLERRGFVHFLVVLDQHNRVTAMRDYLIKIQAINTI